jgi:DNA replication and repair protein RecF
LLKFKPRILRIYEFHKFNSKNLHLEKIILTNFKNYASQTVALSPKLNCFVGLNGMGKTNLLDAVYYMCMTKSYFLNLDSDVILRGSDFLRLEGHFVKKNRHEKIVAKVQLRKKKIVERNDVVYDALSDHIGFLPVVMFAPDDTLLAKEGSEERRRFMDLCLSQIDNQYLTHLIFYNKILEQRNAYLKSLEKIGSNKQNTGGDKQSFDVKLIEVYDTQIAPSAQYIFEKRQDFVHNFSPIFNDIYGKISGEKEVVSIVYESPLLTDNLKNILSKNREKDRILQRTSSGIHRDDLTFTMSDKSLKKFGSQGQLKSFVLSLKLAQHEILRGSLDNENQDLPILLLDDIFDKLDETRIENLLQLIVNQSFGQIFISDTNAARVQEVVTKLNADYKIFNVENGIINDEL